MNHSSDPLEFAKNTRTRFLAVDVRRKLLEHQKLIIATYMDPMPVMTTIQKVQKKLSFLDKSQAKYPLNLALFIADSGISFNATTLPSFKKMMDDLNAPPLS